MSKKQATLFQSWGTKSESVVEKSTLPDKKGADNDNVIDLCASFDDDDDDLLCEAVDQTSISFNDGPSTSKHNLEQQHVGDISVGADGFTQTQGQSQSCSIPGFDKTAGKLWIYPTNYPVREYQFSIVKQALFKNTMVTLPTGLGKTFIAAVVMYNFYRWYPQGKIIFMAPTKPLVAQQIEACYNIMGIPQEHTAEMTGSMGPSKREKAWHDKRVFFLTPQVLTNDLSRGSCPAVDVKCLVIDEAHKALGNHAYCQVVRELIKYTQTFRILSLSATPGSDIKAVQQVLNNLLISQIEIRTEDSIDIKRYSHERKVEKVVVPLGDELSKVKEKYIHILDAVVNKLKRAGVLYNRDTTSLSKFLILKARDAFRQNPPEQLQRNQFGVVEGDFAMAMSLYHGYELLQLHGSRSLYTFLDGILTGEKGYGRTRTELMRNADFNELMKMLSEKYRPSTSDTPSQALAKPLVIGHPKMVKLCEIVLEHFNSYSIAGTRVMIFSQYRDSVQEITNMLDVHKPLIKVMSFIGQASSGKTTKGFTQKEQLKVMKQFREGGYNTLVSTCVGEEGLDIGDVDLIICFDAHKSPIRLVQRMGRTGRKREGRIVMLVTQGKEEQIYNQSQYSKKSIHKAILNGAKSLHFYQNSSRMVPENLNPSCHKMHITVKENFKPTKKLTSDKPINQSRIHFNRKDSTAAKKEAVDGLITLEEYRELEPWLVPESEVPTLPVTELCCLDKDSQLNQEPDGIFFSLSEWSPWQTTLQDTHFVDHSMETKHFVEIMEFVQLQQSLDTTDDPYGLEMAAYFNAEDVVKKDKNRRNSILNYCVPEKNPPEEILSKNTTNKGKRSRVRRSDNLPNFDFLDDKIDEISDEDLPAFNVNCTDVRNDKSEKADSIKVSRTNNEDGSFDACDKIDKSPLPEKSVNIIGKKQVESKAKMLEKKMVVNKNRKRNKSRHRSGHTSMISLIADEDDNDFEDSVFHSSIQMVNDENIDTNSNDSLPEVISFNDVVDNNVDEVDGQDPCVMEVETINPRGVIRIRTPPQDEDTVKLCQDLDKEMETVGASCLDLLELVDEWHNENKKNGKYIVYPSHIPDMYTPNKPNNVDRKQFERRKISVPVGDLKIDTQSRYSRESEISGESFNESDSVFENVKNISATSSTSNTRTSDDVFKTPNVKQPNKVRNKKMESSTKMVADENNKSCKKKLHSDGETSAMDVDTDDAIMATGTFVLDAEDIFSDDEMDYSTNQDVFDMCEKFDEEISGDKKSDSKSTSDDDLGLDLSPLVPVVNQRHDDNDSDNSEKITENVNHKIPFTSNSNAKFDSFLADDDDDDLFVDMKTPDVIHKPLDTSTQITFTQAVNYVHSGSRNSGSESCNETSKHEDQSKVCFSPIVGKVLSPSVKSTSSIDDENKHKSSDSSDIFETPKKLSKMNKTVLKSQKDEKISKSSDDNLLGTEAGNKLSSNMSHDVAASRKSSTSSEDGLQLPEFDLDFDFDEDIIPPSPTNVVPSQSSAPSRLSQVFSFSNRLSQSKCLNKDDSVLDDNDDFEDKSEYLNKATEGNKDLSLDKSTGPGNKILEEESQSLLGDAPVRKQVLSKSRKKSNLYVDKTTLDTIEENTETDTVEDVDDLSKGDQADENMENVDEDISVTESAAVNNEFESSFALIGDDFEEWIDSGAVEQNQSSHNAEDVEKSDSLGRIEPTVDMSHSKSEDGLEEKSNIKIGVLSKKSLPPVATVSPFSSSQDLSSFRISQKRNQNSSTSKDTDKNVRKSIFQLDDLSPDPFEDSFDFTSDMLTGKDTPKCSLKNNSTIRHTSTPLLPPSKPSESVTPFRVENCTLNQTKQTTCGTPIGESKVDTVSDNDDSFIVRRKKKVQILTSQCSPTDRGTERSKDSDTTSRSVSYNNSESIEQDEDFDDSALLRNNDYFSNKQKPKAMMITSSSDEDFEEDNAHMSKKANTNFSLSDEDFEESRLNVNKKSVKSKPDKSKPLKTKARKRSNPFLDEEAVLSDEDDSDASTDEDDGSDQDVYEGSFIASQCTQAMNDTDIHAVYLKSVKSPPHAARGGYKLQFNHRTDIDVFSQRPEPENSEYMEDSFVVHSEEDDWLLGEGEDPGEELEETREVTMMQNSAMYSGRRKRKKGVHAFQTSRQRAIQAGRMKALDEIKAKLAGKGKKNIPRPVFKSSSSDDSVIQKPPSKRSRIQKLDVSTSGDESILNILTSMASPDVHTVKVQSKKKARFLMSSDSEDGGDDFMVGRSMCGSSKTNKVSEVIDLDDETSEAEKNRMERLKRQKEKQAEYRKQLADKPVIEKTARSTEGLTLIKDKNKSLQTGNTDVKAGVSRNSLDIQPSRHSSIGASYSNSNIQSVKRRADGKSVILVDSKEISGAQDIVSDLRFKHNIHVSAAQLPGCDFVISNRMAVERKQWSEFSNGANRAKLVERLQHLGELYDRPCLVVEKDRIKPGDERSVRPVHWTKYIDRTIALLLRSDVSVLYSDSMIETAELLAELCKLEERKNMGICAPVDLNDNQLNLMKFFTSIPKLSYVHALNLCDNFKSVKDFLGSNAAVIEAKGKMSKNRALDVVSFIKRKFDANMLPSHK